MRQFRITYTNMLVSEKPRGPNANPCGPNASRWNIGCFGYPCIGTHVGHVDFMLFVSISLHWVANAYPISGGIWALVPKDGLVTGLGYAYIYQINVIRYGCLHINKRLAHIPLKTVFALATQRKRN